MRSAWSPEEDRLLWELVPNHEISYDEIAKRLRKTKSAIIGRAHRIGIPMRRPRNPRPKERPKSSRNRRSIHTVSRPEAEICERHRYCLVCRDEFLSRHIGERVCPDCKGRDSWRSGNGSLEIWLG